MTAEEFRKSKGVPKSEWNRLTIDELMEAYNTQALEDIKKEIENFKSSEIKGGERDCANPYIKAAFINGLNSAISKIDKYIK